MQRLHRSSWRALRTVRGRRRLITTLATLLVAVGVASAVDATPSDSAQLEAVVIVDGGATASARAVREGRPGQIAFPMDPTPRCDILDDFGDPRGGGRSHEGVDILATEGQAVLAVADGELIKQFVADGPYASLSGNAWRLRDDAGNVYLYAHLSAFADGLAVGSRVNAGTVIGYVGDTGNAGPGNYHLHFEYQPGGGEPIDSLPLLAIPAPCTIT